jgi:hypothetical protein
MTRTVLFLLSLSVLSGCTNVTGDTPRTIFSQHQEPLNTERLFAAAEIFFSEAGYRCSSAAGPGQFRCSRALRDLYIHQTTAEVKIYPADEEDRGHRVIATRWDEGLIPGELIANTYANDDVEAFCAYLDSEKLGRCSDCQG